MVAHVQQHRMRCVTKSMRWVSVSVVTSSSSSSWLLFGFHSNISRYDFYSFLYIFCCCVCFRVIHFIYVSKNAFISAIICLINTITWISHFLIAAHLYVYIDMNIWLISIVTTTTATHEWEILNAYLHLHHINSATLSMLAIRITAATTTRQERERKTMWT